MVSEFALQGELHTARGAIRPYPLHLWTLTLLVGRWLIAPKLPTIVLVAVQGERVTERLNDREAS